MTTLTSVADITVPDWVRRNGEIFRTLASGTDRSKKTRSFEVDQQMQVIRGGVAGAAMKRADMSDAAGQGGIAPPTDLPPASYYQDVKNHSNIASTMLMAARQQVGFQPGIAGQELTAAQIDDFVNKFYKWIMELDNYWPYLDVNNSQVRALWFQSIDQNVSDFLSSFWGLDAPVVEAWRQSLTGMAKSASAYITEWGGNVRTVSFQMDTLDTSGKRNPVQPLTFGRAVQSNPPGGNYDSVLTSGMTYRVDSDAIIADADKLAQNGVRIFGVKEYVNYVNTGQL